VQKWLDLKRIPAAKRETQKEAINSLIEAVSNGDISIADDGVITQKLIFPITIGGGELSELTYKPRLTVGEYKAHTANVKAGDFDGRIMAYVRALTKLQVEVIDRLDTADTSIATSIAIFFMI
jgi:hypothetical protein